MPRRGRDSSETAASAFRAELRRRLGSCLGEIAVPHRALARIINQLAPRSLDEEAEPEVIRSLIQRNVDYTFKSTSHGPVIKTVDLATKSGGIMAVEYIDPPAYLAWLVSEAPRFWRELAPIARQHNGLLSLIVYNDGATCGNMLDVDQAKKCEVFTFSFLELGPARLCCTDWWFWLAAVRNNRVKEAECGLAALWAALLRVRRVSVYTALRRPGRILFLESYFRVEQKQ